MKHFKIILALLITIVFGNCTRTPEEKPYVILKGEVLDRESQTLILKKSTEDARYQGVEIEISDSGYFEHKMDKPKFIEEYELVFKDEHLKGMWRPIPFYPENDTIRFELYPIQQFDKNKIYGSELSLRKKRLEAEYKSNFENRFKYWYSKMDSIQQGEPDANEMSRINNKLDSLNAQVINWQLSYFRDNPDIFSYTRFLELLKQAKDYQISFQSLNELYIIFSKEYPEHPYTRIAANTINGLNNIKVGGQYVDFTAPDSTGKEIAVSSYINKNNLTLVDLWAPWCGPCIKKSKAVQEVYDEIKPKGFDVIAVIGGIKDKDQYFQAIQKFDYPWIMLMELQDKNHIWEKYNIGNSGGSQFLINSNGEILAINPSIEQIKSFLEES